MAKACFLGSGEDVRTPEAFAIESFAVYQHVICAVMIYLRPQPVVTVSAIRAPPP